jgi:environmental stress-induced protein Ves
MILRASERVAQPWKNGGGVTREVAAWPPGASDFDWRVSIAEVESAGPFSHFENIDRVMAILRGRLSLRFDDREVVLDAQSAPFTFPGDVACTGTPLGGPVTDLNVMARRGRCRTQVERVTHATASRGLFVATASARVGGEMLARFDAALIEAQCEIGGAGFLIQFS